VCDKGVSAALFMGIFRSLIHAYMESAFECGSRAAPPLKIKEKPGSLADRMQGALSFLNNYIEKHHGKEGIFATLFFGILDTRDGQLEYINAGHDPLMIVKGKSVLRELLPTGPAIGITSAARFTIGTVRIDQGETLIGFTDGITDASPKSGERFCRAGIHASIERLNRPGKALIRTILKDVFRHLKGSDLTDDIAMISISRMTKTR
jgi:sigma-B regulation protein RsbU (phosphoserine phosphatase)